MPSIKDIFKQDDNIEDFKNVRKAIGGDLFGQRALSGLMKTRDRQVGVTTFVGSAIVAGVLTYGDLQVDDSDVAQAARDSGFVTKSQQISVAKSAVDKLSTIKLVEHYETCTENKTVALLEGCETVYEVNPDTNDVTEIENPVLSP